MATNYPQYPYNMQTPHNYYYHPNGQIINPFQTPINMYNNHHGGVGADEMINNGCMNNLTMTNGNNDHHHHHHHHHGGVGAGEMINNNGCMNNMTMTNGVNNDHQGAQDTNNNTINIDDYDLTDLSFDGLVDFIMMDNNNQESNDDSDDYLKQLPVGYRFLPNDNELIYYLRMKVNNEALPSNRLRTIDLYEYSPQDLARLLGRNEEEGWYFFTRLQSKNKGAKYASRTTPNGHWKATSGDNQITNQAGQEIGTRKALVYYEGKSKKTDWIMHEYRLKHHSEVTGILVLCRIHKNHNKKANN